MHVYACVVVVVCMPGPDPRGREKIKIILRELQDYLVCMNETKPLRLSLRTVTETRVRVGPFFL